MNSLIIASALRTISIELRRIADAISKEQPLGPAANRARGEDHPKAVLTDDEIAQVRRRYAAGLGYKSLAREFNTSRSTIVGIVRRRVRQTDGPSTRADVPIGALRTVAAARYLGISIALLRKWRLRGSDEDHGPPFSKLGPNLVVYRLSDLDAWIARHRNG